MVLTLDNESWLRLAVRLIYQTNALNAVTTNAYSFDANGQHVTTVTHPDGSTRIEHYYADGQLAKVTGTGANPVRYEYGVEQDDGVWRQFRKEIKLDASYADTPEWTKTYTDMLGRDYKTVFAAASTPYPYRQSFYNCLGQLWKERDPDGAVTLYGYDAKGQRVYTAIDINRNDQIDFNGTDRITWTTNDVTTYSGYNVTRSRTFVYGTNNSPATTLVSMTMTATSGLKSWSTAYRDGSTPVTTLTETGCGPNGARTVTTTAPDGSSTVNTYLYGRLQSVTRKDSGGSQVSQTVYAYDAVGRVASSTDARNGTTTYTYNNAGDLAAISYTGGTPGTSYTYDRRGRRSQIVRNGITTTLTYNDANQPLTESHSAGTLAALA